MKKKDVMHLFILKTCFNKCPLCCNNLYDIDKIPVATVEELKEVHTVCFTGGEPFLYSRIDEMACLLRLQYPNIRDIFVYTSGASLKDYLDFHEHHIGCLKHITGVSVAPKSQKDWLAFEAIYKSKPIQVLVSNRLYVYDKNKSNVIYERFNTISRIWRKTFDTPENEIFRRLPILLD